MGLGFGQIRAVDAPSVAVACNLSKVSTWSIGNMIGLYDSVNTSCPSSASNLAYVGVASKARAHVQVVHFQPYCLKSFIKRGNPCLIPHSNYASCKSEHLLVRLIR